MRVLVTGSSGLIGRRLTRVLGARGDDVVPFDLLEGRDVRDAQVVEAAMTGVDGVIHLAAISRVAWGEEDPAGCRATNVGGTRNVVAAAGRRRIPVVFASSREVYGEPDRLPVTEDAPLAPLNVYAQTKVDGERIVADAAAPGAIVRLSNVYGDALDHRDRVVPAFVLAALNDEELRVDGEGHTFDFTHLDDTVAGLVCVLDRVRVGASPPPIHLVSGVGTTLGELAVRAGEATGRSIRVRHAPPRTYDVSRFVGDPRRAVEVLGWRATVDLRAGLALLAASMR